MIKEGQSHTDSLPIRRWRIELCMLNNQEEEVPLDILSECVFHLHPTFKEPIRRLTQPPFALEENGWGEFEMAIQCYFIENVGKFTINHMLSFESKAQAIDYSVKVPCHTPLIREYLSKHFELPEINFDHRQENEISPAQVRHWINLIPKLDDDTVTEIVQLILAHPAVQAEVNKHPRHEDFLMSLYQLPNELLQKIGDYVLDESRGADFRR